MQTAFRGDVSALYKDIPKEEIKNALKMPLEKAMQFMCAIPYQNIRRFKFRDEYAFVRYVASLESVQAAYKVVIPRNVSTGANYYIVHGVDKQGEVVAFFRGTYGYAGTGPLQSAFVELAFKMLKIPLEIRDGDYLLSLLKL